MVRQVPFSPLAEVQGSLGKVTTLKMPKPVWGEPELKIIFFRF